MNMVDDLELKELQSVYEKLDIEGKQEMLSIAKKLLEAHRLSVEEDSKDSTKSCLNHT